MSASRPLVQRSGELPSFSPGRQVFQLHPALLDDAMLKERVDHPSSVVLEHADDVAQVELFVEEEFANLDGMRPFGSKPEMS